MNALLVTFYTVASLSVWAYCEQSTCLPTSGCVPVKSSTALQTLMCFHVVSEILVLKHSKSLLLSVLQWVPEITHHCPKTPFLLVGTQIDLRDDPSTTEKLAKNKQKPITPETAEKLARDLKAVKYVECSALTQVSALTALLLCNGMGVNSLKS